MVEINLISVWGIELDLIPVQDEIDLLCGLSKMISFECDGAASIWFWCSGRKFLFSASGSKLTGFSCRGIEIDLVLELGSK